MCKTLFLNAETDAKKQKEIQQNKIAKKEEGDKLYFLFGKDAECVEKLKQIIKKKKPEKVVLNVGKAQQKVLDILKELGLNLKPVDQSTYVAA